VPSVIYRDHDEESWSPTPDELQMRMIDRAEFEAWPATVPAARPTARRPPPPPRGDLARHTDPSPRLTEVLEELRELRLRRLILVIIRAATTDPAVAQALHHLRAQAARLRRQQTRQHHHARRARADESPPAAPRRQAPRR
jgi:hypothetical protein